ncbi:CAP domain-containing protein [Coprobacillus cateniformis]|uniref:CAP domain-containing protein n=1 Tax=Coprobacillus cateniformis TaxID=100884 RepID=UPI0039A0A9F4
MKRKIVVSLMILMFPMLVGCQKETMTLKIDSVTVEYGSSISVKAEDYLKNEKDFLDKVEVAVNAENEKDKKYPPKGEYELLLKHDDNIEKVKVIVKDTIAPKLEIKDKYTIEYNSKLDQKELKATDLSKTTITLDDSKVNYKKAGTYKATVIAKDESNNETKKEIEIVVKEEKKKEQATTEKKNNSSNPQNSNKKPNSSNTSKPNSNNTTGTTTQSTSKISMEAFNLINQERLKLGRSQLQYASEWENIVKKRAVEITSNFSHNGLNNYFSAHSVGECLSHGHGGASNTVLKGWMKSSNHKAILMDPENTKLIVAVNGDYWVALVQ